MSGNAGEWDSDLVPSGWFDAETSLPAWFDDDLLVAPNGSGAGALVGAASVAVTASGTLAGVGVLAGTAVANVNASATLKGAVALTGAATAGVSAVGSLLGGGTLAGAATASVAASGTLKGAGTLAGAAALSASATGTMLGSGALAGAAALSVAAAGTALGKGALGGAAAIAAAASGTMTGRGALAGGATVTVLGTGTARGAGVLSGAAQVLALAAAVMLAIGTLSGSASASVSSAGALVSGTSGGASASSSASGTLSADSPVGGAAGARVDAGGMISSSAVCSGAAVWGVSLAPCAIRRLVSAVGVTSASGVVLRPSSAQGEALAPTGGRNDRPPPGDATRTVASLYAGAMYEDCCEPDECCEDPTLLRSYRGDTLLFQFTVYAPAPASGSPQNLTGWFLQFTAKYQTSDQDSQAVATAKTTGIVPNVITFPNGAAAGIVQVQVGPLSTVSLADGPTRLDYAVICIDPSGNRTTVRVGKWIVRPSAARATSPS